MKKRKPKITVTIEDDKVTLTMEGGVPPIIAQTIPDLIASSLHQYSSSTKELHKPKTTLIDMDSWTVREKVRYIVLRYCRHGWFTSQDIKELYDQTFHPTIALATASTYLARMYKEEDLSRRGSTAQREYRVNVEHLENEIASILATKVE